MGKVGEDKSLEVKVAIYAMIDIRVKKEQKELAKVKKQVVMFPLFKKLRW